MAYVTSPGGNVELTYEGYIPSGANQQFGTAGTDRPYFGAQAGQPVSQGTLIEAGYPTSAQAGFTGMTDLAGSSAQPTAGAQLQTTQPTAQPTTSVSQTPQFPTSQAGYQNPLLTTPSAGALPAGQTGATQPGYVNPSQVSQSTKEFGEDTGQFMIEPFAQPFPFEQQRAENQQLVSGFEQAIAGQETLPAMRSRYEGQFFIPEQREMFQQGREALSDAMAQIRGMPEQIAGTSRESLMTEGQRQNLLGAKLEPLQRIATQLGENVSRIGAMLTENEKNLNDAMMLEVAQQKKELTPWTWRFDLDKILQSREFSSFTFSNELELNRLIGNRNAGLTWTNAESQRAHELSLQEQSYDLALRNSERMADFRLDLWG